MVYVNPSKILEVISELERQNIKYNTIYEEINKCRLELDQFSSLSKEVADLGKVNKRLQDEIDTQVKQINILNQIAELYLKSDDRAYERTENGRVAENSLRPGISQQAVPENDIPINVFN